MAKRNYDVILAERADLMLLTHTEFLAKVSPQAACKLIAEFKKVLQKLKHDPTAFPFADELDAPGIVPKTYRKCLFYGRYKALFLIAANSVFIDAIIDCRQENAGVHLP